MHCSIIKAYKLNPISTYSKINKHFMVMKAKQQIFTVAFWENGNSHSEGKQPPFPAWAKAE